MRCWGCGRCICGAGGGDEQFRYLKVALAVVLGVVGVKMLAAKPLKSVLGERFNL